MLAKRPIMEKIAYKSSFHYHWTLSSLHGYERDIMTYLWILMVLKIIFLVHQNIFNLSHILECASLWQKLRRRNLMKTGRISPVSVNIFIIRVIPQCTVDKNLGQDRLAGPKALDPNYCRQPTL